MSSGSSSQTPASADQIRQQVRQAFEQLRDLSRGDIPLDQFCQALLHRVVPLTGAHGCMVWQADGGNGFQPLQSLGPRVAEIAPGHPRHRDLLQEVAREGQPLAIQASAIGLPVAQGEFSDRPDMLLLIVPVLDRSERVWGMLELLQRSGIPETARDGYLRFLQQLATLFTRWHEQKELRAVQAAPAAHWPLRMEMAKEIHSARGVRETAFAIANEVRRLLNADRVSVAVWNGRHCRVEAISSQDKFDNRANVVRMLGRIADGSVRSDEPLWINGDTSLLSPSVATHVNAYLEESHARTLAVLPVRPLQQAAAPLSLERRPRLHRDRPCGALILEFFDREIPQSGVQEDLTLGLEHSTIGLTRALDEDAVFLMPLWRTLGRMRKLLFGDALRKTVAAATALLLFTLFLCFWPLQLKMRVDGVLQPEVRRNLFSEIDGVVTAVRFDHNETVRANDVVIELESQQLRLSRLELEGQIHTLSEQIDGLSRQLTQRRDIPEADRFEMVTNKDQLEIQRQGFEDQLAIVRKQMESLQVISPIDGTVVMWDARHRLENLPVAANQPLMSVADLNGRWQVELTIPQNRVGYIQQALKSVSDGQLPAQMILATDPNRRIPGKLVRIATRAEPGADGQTFFRGIVELDRQLIERPQPGAGVTVRIECGPRAAGFVWFYQLIDFVRTRVLF